MNIDRDKLARQAADIFWNHPGKAHDSSLVTIDFLVDAVLAEVAKHNTPDKAAYYKTSERKPTNEDAKPSGRVLGYVSEEKCWYAVGYEAASAAYDFWMPMPAPIISEDDAAFSEFVGRTNILASEHSAAKLAWLAALDYARQHTPKP